MKINQTPMQGQGAAASAVADIFAKLGIGDVLKVRVADIKSGEVILKLIGGGTFSAFFPDSMVGIKKGDIVELLINNKMDGQIFVELLKQEGQKQFFSVDAQINKILLSIDVPPTEKNIEIAKELKLNDIQVSKENIQNVSDMVLKFKGITPEKAVYFLANQLPFEEKNISELNKLLESKLKMGVELENIFKDLEGIEDEGFQKGLSKVLSDLGLKEQVMLSKELDKADAVKQLVGKIEMYNMRDVPEEIRQMDLPKKAVEFVIKNLDISEILSKSSILAGQIHGAEFTQNHEMINKAELGNVVFSASHEIQKNLENQLSKPVLLEHLKSIGMDIKLLPTEKQDAILNLFKGLILKANEDMLGQNNIVNKAVTEQELIHTEKNILKSIAQSLFVKIDKNTTGEDISASKIYKDIYASIEVLKSAVEASNIENKSDILAKMDNFQSSIRFLNEINNSSTYIQIPLNLLSKNTTGELFILKKNPKKKKLDPENAVLYLALNTMNMGEVDSLVFIDKKNVSINFRLENIHTINFFKENYIELNNMINGNGYKLVSVRYRLQGEDINLVNIKKTIKNEENQANTSIDCKI